MDEADFGSELAILTKDDLFGFHAALESKRGDFGALEYVMRNAPTVRDALDRLARYDHAINTQVRVEIDLHTGRVVERIPGHPECLGRHGNEFAVAHKVKVARDLLGPAFAPRRVFFAHAPPSSRATMQELEDWFRGSDNIVHRADANGIELPPSLLEMRIGEADPALLGILEERLGGTEKKDAGEKDDLAAIRNAIAEDVASAELDGEAFASRLGMSRRTLHRRLASIGTTFRELVDDVRREMATAYLRDAERSLADVAAKLGYSDARAFSRAFQRWTGETPASFRRKSRA